MGSNFKPIFKTAPFKNRDVEREMVLLSNWKGKYQNSKKVGIVN
jgi:hypothetical protein